MVRVPARWSPRDWLAATGLFTATAAVVLLQNAHVAVLWDLTYVLDTATRIALGQLPYRDFPLAHAPLTFLIQAAIIRVTGRVFFHHVLYAAIVGGFATVLTWRIALRILLAPISSPWLTSLALSAPLAVLGIYCILPLPSYDCDCAFATLLAIWLMLSLNAPRPESGAPSRPGNPPFSYLRSLVTGASLCLPLFCKQNIGLPFLGGYCAVIAILFICAKINHVQSLSPNPSASSLLLVLAGAAATLITAALVIQLTVGLGNYFHWTIGFAAQRRLPGLQQMLGVYNDPQLLWTVPCILAGFLLLRTRLAQKRWTQIAAFALLAAPFIYTLCSLLIYDDADERGDSLLALWPMLLILAAVLALRNLLAFRRTLSLQSLLPFVLLVAIHGALMSQQLWGSTYAIWPLLTLLLAEMIAYLAQLKTLGPSARSLATPIAFVIATTMLICGGFYTASEERLSYAQLPNAPVAHSSFPRLKGMSITGPYLPNLDELLRYTSANIPASDGIILVPGEDPFYFATGRIPQFPVLLFDPATDPYSPTQVRDEARRHNIRWLIVKRRLQLKADPTPQREATLNLLMKDFDLSARLNAYDIYHRP